MTNHVDDEPDETGHLLRGALPRWPAFPEVPASLERLRTLGWRLAIHSLVVLVAFTVLVMQLFQKSVQFDEMKSVFGTLLVFRRSDNSWHGHKPFVGPRRAVQLNWVTTQDVADHEQLRHQFATKLKKIKNMFIPSSAALGH